MRGAWPRLLWGGDIKKFHPLAGRFDGVIGGPPCTPFSRLAHIIALNRKRCGDSDKYKPAENLIPEFERCVIEAMPEWFLMENVPDAPHPQIDDYITRPFLLNNRWLGQTQNRLRRFCFGTRDGRVLKIATQIFEPAEYDYAVCAAGGSGIPVKTGDRAR